MPSGVLCGFSADLQPAVPAEGPGSGLWACLCPGVVLRGLVAVRGRDARY